MRGGRWITASILDKEEQAMTSAQRNFQDRKCEGVRILSVLDRPDGSSHEKEIFVKTRNVQRNGIRRPGGFRAAPLPKPPKNITASTAVW